MELTERTELLAVIRQKAESDELFKEHLLLNPQKAIEDFTGKPVGLSRNEVLEVNQLEDSSLVINISNSDNSVEDVELTEEELDIISGGGELPGLKLRSN